MKEAFNREPIKSSAAGDMSFIPAGDVSSTNVQTAIEEVDTKKMKRIVSVDNEIARFDGTGGDVQGYSSNAPVISDDGVIKIANATWISGSNFAGSGVVNMFKINVDDEIDVGGTLVLGASLEAAEDSGQVTRTDMPISASAVADSEQSFTDKLDGGNAFTYGAFADGAGGVGGHFVKHHGAFMVHKTDAGAADYNPSALTSDYIITVDTTGAARAVTISAEDRDSGSASKPRIFIIKDIAGNAGANNITISLETAGTIDGAATAVISTNYNSLTLVIDGTNAFII